MWSLGVVVFPPLFDDDFCLLQAVENPLIQKFIPEAGIEELAIAVLPRRAEVNVVYSVRETRLPRCRTRMFNTTYWLPAYYLFRVIHFCHA